MSKGVPGLDVPMPTFPLVGNVFCAHAGATPPITNSGIISDRQPRHTLSLVIMPRLLVTFAGSDGPALAVSADARCLRSVQHVFMLLLGNEIRPARQGKHQRCNTLHRK